MLSLGRAVYASLSSVLLQSSTVQRACASERGRAGVVERAKERQGKLEVDRAKGGGGDGE